MTTRKMGNYNNSKNKSTYLSWLRQMYGWSEIFYAGMNQTHGNTVQMVKNQDIKEYMHTDGLVTSRANIFLMVNTADCVPIFLYDPKLAAIGIIHAGWKGTLGTIISNTIAKLQDIGSDPKNIYAAIGPHIGGCCYSVNEDRAQVFQALFQNNLVVFQENDIWNIDLGLANKLQLLESGVWETHIDAPITCTSCQNHLYFSYRKDSQESFGEMLGIIGMNAHAN